MRVRCEHCHSLYLVESVKLVEAMTEAICRGCGRVLSIPRPGITAVEPDDDVYQVVAAEPSLSEATGPTNRLALPPPRPPTPDERLGRRAVRLQKTDDGSLLASSEDQYLRTRYMLEECLEHGPDTEVFLARRTDTRELVVVKVFDPDFSGRPVHIPNGEPLSADRFAQAAVASSTFDHANIARVHDFVTRPSGLQILEMEYVDGPSLLDLVTEGPMAPSDLLPLLIQACDGVQHIHTRGFVHGTLGMTNLLVKGWSIAEPLVKIVGFEYTTRGASWSRWNSGREWPKGPTMAPEQLRPASVDHRADIFALGAILYRALTGTYPDGDDRELALQTPFPKLNMAANHLYFPGSLNRVVERCLQPSPRDRYRSAARVGAELEMVRSAHFRRSARGRTPELDHRVVHVEYVPWVPDSR